MVRKIKTLFIIILVVALAGGFFHFSGKIDRLNGQIARYDAAIDSVNKIAQEAPDTVRTKDTVYFTDSVVKRITDTIKPVKDTQGIKIYRDSITRNRFKVVQTSWVDGTLTKNSLLYKQNYSIQEKIKINNKIGYAYQVEEQNPGLYLTGSILPYTYKAHLRTGFEAGVIYDSGGLFQYSLNFGRLWQNNYIELGINYKIASYD